MKATTTLFTLILVFALNAKCQEITRDGTTNLLKIEIEGGNQGFEDEAYIHFREGATTGYDEAYDAKKWYSIDPEATMIWTVASDATDLAINKLPLSDLHSILNTVPLQFVCGYGGGEYVLSFSELDTFDESVEIWLEDLTTGEGWILISENENTYTFTGLPDEPADRFKIHIQDATIITGFDKQNQIDPLKIYSAGNKVYIKNPEGVEITNIQIFNLLGQAVQHKINYASLDLSKVQIDESAGYYIAQVTVDKHVYTEKVFIKNF